MKKTALLFPGQGSQYVGMGKKLVEQYAEARVVFEEANDALGFDLQRLCFEGDVQELTRTENAQPALLATGTAAFRVFEKEFGIPPHIGAGHSLGEFTALSCAGAIGFADALRLVRQRGRLMQEAVSVGDGAMADISGHSWETVEAACQKHNREDHVVVISNENAPTRNVISGQAEAVKKAASELEGEGIKITFLKVSAPFHSPLMAPAAEKFKEVLEKIDFNPPKWPVLSNVTAKPHTHAPEIRRLLATQITAPVKWNDCMGYLGEAGIKLAVEMSPKKVLKNLLQRNTQIPAFSFDHEVEQLAETLAAYYRDLLDRTMALAVSARNRNFDEAAYAKNVVEPYQAIKQLALQLEEKGAPPTQQHATQAIQMLQTVLSAKNLPAAEQAERMAEIAAL